MICVVFGHRKIEDDKDYLKNKIREEITKLIEEKDVNIFLFGGFGEFDELCYQVVTELKNKKYNFLERIYCCEDEKIVDNPYKMPSNLKHGNYEKVIFLPMQYKWFYKRIYFRNCEMIKESDYCLFYVRQQENSGAYKAYQFAHRLKKNCILV